MVLLALIEAITTTAPISSIINTTAKLAVDNENPEAGSQMAAVHNRQETVPEIMPMMRPEVCSNLTVCSGNGLM